MSIKNLHTTIDYKKLIESQANTVIERVNPQDKFKSKNGYSNSKVKKKIIKRK